MKKRRNEEKIRARQRCEAHRARRHGGRPQRENRHAWERRDFTSFVQRIIDHSNMVRMNYS